MLRTIDLLKLNIAEVDSYLTVSMPGDIVNICLRETCTEQYSKSTDFTWIEAETNTAIDNLELAIIITNSSAVSATLDTKTYCINIGYIGKDNLWPVANPWTQTDPLQGNVLIQLCEKEFAKNILKAVDFLNINKNYMNSTVIVLNMHSNVNAKQLIWAVNTMIDCGFTNIKVASAEDYSKMFEVNNLSFVPYEGGLTQ